MLLLATAQLIIFSKNCRLSKDNKPLKMHSMTPVFFQTQSISFFKNPIHFSLNN